ncbi:HD domain-containing phosphohydrolase [Halomonas sp. NO4]|uniref:HD domain-containing phosphohydrolase n=1 Tax=Halomonas sp. NO4 TaxID=2484813 RepID=UPI0013D0FFA1|nr:HD domain-containing phosphohydrolase [Halomonas sp. NO4]
MTDSPPLVATLLLVDDEPHVLSALRRELRREGYRLLTADNGKTALERMAEECIDAIISDALMPGMDGIELLAQVQRDWPECLRLLLTGKADLNAAVRAINEGRIYHYIAKPWDATELRQTLRLALSHQQAERERQRLETLTRAQNRELVALNANLEQRVADRTAELQQTANMLDAAYGDLEQSYVTATRVFASLINQRLPRHLQTNATVGNLLTAFAEQLGLDEESQRDLQMAAALYNLGKLTWNDHLLTTPSERLFAADRDAYRRYPETGESLLMALEHLEGTATIIRHHRERWNGSGFPDHLKEQAIPYGARLLSLAVDFIELQRGMILPRKVPRHSALALLEKFAGRVYDPALVAPFVELCLEQAPDLGVGGRKVLSLEPRKLEPGMQLAQDLHSPAGMLLLNQGKELSRGLIDKLIRLEELEDTRLTLLVHPAEESDAEPEPGTKTQTG